MDDPHTVRTLAKGCVAADTSRSKMMHCDHTFSGQALFEALRKERQCPRCGIKPYTLDANQRSSRSLLYRNNAYDTEIQAWYTGQLALDLEKKRNAPPNNTPLCVCHVVFTGYQHWGSLPRDSGLCGWQSVQFRPGNR